ncbi:MAG: glycosyltransferase family 2 protein [Paludibacteraceae bacterium]|nr:glycosyltransferase family 2 protein [Paludibacteraceae bacterium]
MLAGIVLYNPEVERLKANISSIVNQVDKLVLIENGSTSTEYLQDPFFKNIEVIFNGGNLGIARALNQICDYAKKNSYKWVLTLDQDSVCPANIISEYKKFVNTPCAGMLCPVIEDRNVGMITGFDKEPVSEVSLCITSASLLNVDAWQKVGGFYEPFFIDGVDFDMCMLLSENGYKIYRVNSVKLVHEVGRSKKVNCFGREEIVFNHGPIRCYYMIRNRVLLGKRHANLMNQLKVVLKRFVLINLYEHNRIEKNCKGFKGLLHGFIGKYGMLLNN